MYYVEGKKESGWTDKTICLEDHVVARTLYEEMINSGDYVYVETNLPTIEGVWYGNQRIN